jgi:DNA-binding PadR family transcriptional regulator
MSMFEKRRFSRGQHYEGNYEYDYDYHYAHFSKGDLKYVILDLIKDKPRYGYEIIRALEDRSLGFYKPSPGAVYPTLQMLEEMGYISCTEQDSKKVYSITQEGLKFLKERKGIADEIRDHMKRHWNPKNVGEFAETMFQLHRAGSKMKRRFRNLEPGQMQRIKEVVSRACKEIEAILEE